MAHAMKCDRCKEYYDSYPLNSKYIVRPRKLPENVVNDLIKVNANYIDLCPRCADALDNFMEHPVIVMNRGQ